MCLEFSPLEIALAGLGIIAKCLTVQGLWDESKVPYVNGASVDPGGALLTRGGLGETSGNPISTQLLINTLLYFNPHISLSTAKSHSLLLVDCIKKTYTSVFGILEQVPPLYGGIHSVEEGNTFAEMNTLGFLGMPQLAPID